MKSVKYWLFVVCLLTGLSLEAKDYPKREMRAVWIATVVNIDWPSKAGLMINMQQKEMLELFDLAKQFKLNTIVFQIRPASDAFYQSNIEPWSQWLSGTQGLAPDSLYDPLDFAIKECRKRGLEIHVWLNPYRAVFNTKSSSVSVNHPIKTHPDWFVEYGKTTYFNPGLPETRNHVTSVVADIVRRYPVDAIHFDDYFYPYRIAGKEFPDQEAFEMYPRGFAHNQKEDWRRDNVDLVIAQLHDTIKAINSNVEFGISPFGVWRNQSKDDRGSATKAGQTNYDDLYADVLKWQQKGWIDYVTPQIYWHIGKKVADYAVIADWWNKNAYGCKLYIGHALYRIDKNSKDKPWRSSKQIIKQVKLNRTLPNVEGSMFFSAKYLRSNPLKLRERLSKRLYKYEALPPINNRVEQITATAPIQTKIRFDSKEIHLQWEVGLNNAYYVVYRFKKGKYADTQSVENIIRITGSNAITGLINKHTNPEKYYYMVSAVSKTNQESKAVLFD